MRIAIDYSAGVGTNAGIGFLTIELTKALREIDQENEYLIFTDQLTAWDEFIYLPKPKGPGSGLRWMRKFVAECEKSKVDIIISPTSLTMPLLSNKVIQVVNDLSPVVFPRGFSLKKRLIYRAGLSITARKAKGIFFISETVKNEFTARYKTKAKLSYSLLGLNEFINTKVDPELEKQLATKLELPENYVSSVSTLEPRKNFENMIYAFARFAETNPSYQYLIGGKKGWMYESLFYLVKELGIEDKVRFLGFITDEEKYVLLKSAKAFMYVSHYEGFGLPNIESYALGVPVVTSDIEVMHEVMEDHALYAEPKSVSDILSKLSQAVISPRPEVDPKFLARFDWKHTARSLMELYK